MLCEELDARPGGSGDVDLNSTLNPLKSIFCSNYRTGFNNAIELN